MTDRTHTLDGLKDRLRRDERGVSELLGAILLFALVLSVVVLIQVNAVPASNKQVEFQHSQNVQDDILRLEADLAAAAGGGDRTGVVDTGLIYPNRFLLFNPGPVAGTLATEESSFAIVNATADGETGDYWNGTARSFEDRRLVYRPAYNYYDGPRTTLSAGVVYNRFDGDTILQVDRGSFISGSRISLVALDGDFQQTNVDATAVEFTPISAPTETVSVTDQNGPLTVRLATDLSAAQWRVFLDDELNGTDGRVQAVRSGGSGFIEVVMEPGVTYQLELAKVGVGSGATAEEPAYLTNRGVKPTVLNVGGTEFTVQLRDQYNAPKAREPVTFQIKRNGTVVNTPTVLTDESGIASVTVAPNGNAVTDIVAFYDPNETKTVNPKEEFVVRYGSVSPPDEIPQVTGDLKSINDATRDIVLDGVELKKGGVKSDTYAVTLRNQGTTSYTFTEARVSFVLASADPTTVTLTRASPTPQREIETLNITDQFENITSFSDPQGGGPLTIPGGGTVILEFKGDKEFETSGAGNFDSMMIVTFEVDSGIDSEYLTYFISD